MAGFVAGRRRGLAAGLVIGAAAASHAAEKEQKKQQQKPTVVVVEKPGQPQHPPPQQGGGYPPQGAYPPPNQGYPPPGQYYPPPSQGYPPPGQGYPQPGQGYPPPQGYPPQGGYPPPQGYPPAGYPPPSGYPPQSGYPPAGYPPPHGSGGYPPAPYSAPPAPAGYAPPQPDMGAAGGYPTHPVAHGGYPPSSGHPPSSYPPPQAPAAPEPHPPPYAQPAAPSSDVHSGSGSAAASSGKQFEKKFFFLVNESNCYVLQIPRDNPKPGVSLTIEKKRDDGPAHQLWYTDQNGIIRSKISDLALVCKESGEKVKTIQFTGDIRQKWVLRGNKIVNEMFSDECVGLKKGLLIVPDDADIIGSKYQGKPYQHWRAEYV